MRQLWAGHTLGWSQSTSLLWGALVPANSPPNSSTHQQLRSLGSHWILSNSPVTLLHLGISCAGALGPMALERRLAARASCSHPVSSPVTQRFPQAVGQHRSEGVWHWESRRHGADLAGHMLSTSNAGHRPTPLLLVIELSVTKKYESLRQVWVWGKWMFLWICTRTMLKPSISSWIRPPRRCECDLD